MLRLLCYTKWEPITSGHFATFSYATGQAATLALSYAPCHLVAIVTASNGSAYANWAVLYYIYISMLTIIVGDWPLPRSPGVPREMLTTCEAVSLRPPGALRVPSRQGSIRTTLPKSPKADCKEVLRTLGVAGVACSRKCPCTYMNFPSTFHELSMSFHKVSMNRDPSFDPLWENSKGKGPMRVFFMGEIGQFQRETCKGRI